LIHALRSGKVPIVMPRLARYGEHVDDHQLELSLALESEQRIIVAHDSEGLLSAVEKAQRLQMDRISKPKGTPEIVRMVGSLIDSLAAS